MSCPQFLFKHLGEGNKFDYSMDKEKMAIKHPIFLHNGLLQICVHTNKLHKENVKVQIVNWQTSV